MRKSYAYFLAMKSFSQSSTNKFFFSKIKGNLLEKFAKFSLRCVGGGGGGWIFSMPGIPKTFGIC